MGESYDKLCTELNQLVDEWSRYIRLTVMSKEPQPQSPADREILKQEIDDQLGQINEYKEAVDQLKFENLDVFAKIENSSKMCQTKHSPIREDKLYQGSSCYVCCIPKFILSCVLLPRFILSCLPDRWSRKNIHCCWIGSVLLGSYSTWWLVS